MSDPIKKILSEGPRNLSDAELLGLLVGGVGPAEAILDKFGGMAKVFAATEFELEETIGVSKSKVASLLSVREIALRIWDSTRRLSPRVIRTGADAYSIFSGLFYEDQEVVSVAFLNTRHQVIRCSEVFRGTISVSPAQPREILRQALRANAVKIVVAHNHPSGEPDPSDDDEFFTLQLEMAAKTVGIPLLDHLIVGSEGRYFSFAEAKRLMQFPRERVRKRGVQSPGDPYRKW